MRIVERRVTFERGAPATDARELRCPLNAGCRDARLSLTARQVSALGAGGCQDHQADGRARSATSASRDRSWGLHRAHDTTCGNWTKSAEGSAIVGHHDRAGLK